MDGMKFGFGLAAGLLIGLAVVASSGGLTAVAGVFTSASPASQSLASSSTSSQSESQSTSASYNPATSNLTNSAGTTATSSASSASVSAGPAAPVLEWGPLNLPSSSIASIPKQPPASNAILLVPILAALLVGAARYRASRQGSDESE